jgi:hypothetical protein
VHRASIDQSLVIGAGDCLTRSGFTFIELGAIIGA